MQTISPQIANEVRNKMAREGLSGSREELNAIFAKRFNEAVSASRIYPPDRSHVIDMTLGKCGAEETAIEAWSITNVDYGRACADATACVCVFFAGVLAVDPTAFRPRFRNVPDPDFIGEPRPDPDNPGPHRDDLLRER